MHKMAVVFARAKWRSAENAAATVAMLEAEINHSILFVKDISAYKSYNLSVISSYL